MEWATNERDKRAHAVRVIKRGVCGECPSPPWGLAKMRAVQKTELGNNCGLFSDQSHLAFSSLTFFTVLNTFLKTLFGVSLRRRALVFKTNPFFLLGRPIKTLRSKVLFF